MLRWRENIELDEPKASEILNHTSGDMPREKDEESFNIREEIRLLIEIQDILDELDILAMVRDRIRYCRASQQPNLRRLD